MAEPDDRQLDVTLEAFFRDALDGQCGRAERAFRRHVAPPAPRTVNGWKRNVWMIGAFGFGAAVAASMTVLWASPLIHITRPNDPRVSEGRRFPSPPPAQRAALIAPTMEQDVQSELVDVGTVVLADQTPVHVYRRRQVERTRYFGRDANLLSEQVVPRDDLVFVKLTTH